MWTCCIPPPNLALLCVHSHPPALRCCCKIPAHLPVSCPLSSLPRVPSAAAYCVPGAWTVSLLSRLVSILSSACLPAPASAAQRDPACTSRAEWLHPQLSLQTPLPFHRPHCCLCPMPCLTWLCGEGLHLYIEPGMTWGPARLCESAFSWGGRTRGSFAS